MKHTAAQALVTIAIALTIALAVQVIQARAGETPGVRPQRSLPGFGVRLRPDADLHGSQRPVQRVRDQQRERHHVVLQPQRQFNGSAGSSIDRALNFNRR